MKSLPYEKDELYNFGPQRTFKADAKEAAFLLGGIGTGNVSIGSRGELKDWEIFNKPGKGVNLPYTFFAIRIKEDGKDPIARVLESRLQPPFSKSHGFDSTELAGLPRFANSNMKGEYPFVTVELEDDSVNACIKLEAYTPFIPLEPADSGIPCAILSYSVTNTSNESMDVSVVGSLFNAIGHTPTINDFHRDTYDGNANELRHEKSCTGLFMHSKKFSKEDIRYGSMCLSVMEEDCIYKRYWMKGSWWDGVHDFWDDFCDDGLLENEIHSLNDRYKDNDKKVGSIGIHAKLASGESRQFQFVLTWNFPNRPKMWGNPNANYESNVDTIVKNHYSKYFQDAWDVGKYVFDNQGRLEKDSRQFHKALFSGTMPNYVLDAVSSNITVLRSNTCFWLENGDFLGWEGCFDRAGSCPGSCTHVWNYAQTLAFLFPTLERSMRRIEFEQETDTSGKMAFRAETVFGKPRMDYHAAADGQMGTIVRLYREWKISGDTDFLRSLWDKAKAALEYAFVIWDSDGDFVLDAQQHNTYDIEFYGPNSLVNSLFFAALKAGAEMAEELGEHETAEKYKAAWEQGSAKMDRLLWGGEYYIQLLDDVNKFKYQYGIGCLSDQVFGQFLAHVVGLGYILPEGHVKTTIKSIFENNFLDNYFQHHNVQRTYVLNDEKGLLLCSWPKGGRPKLPFVYSDEVWTGIEYQVAAHLIYEGHIDEGLSIVKAVRDRHDGYRRNPWNEVECGHHYARSMASWALLTSLSGYKCDLVKGVIEFSPSISKDNFSSFFICGKAWGIFKQQYDANTGKFCYQAEVLHGSIEGIEVKANGENVEVVYSSDFGSP